MVGRGVIERAIARVDEGARVVDVQRLVGGVSAEVHRVTVRGSDGEVRHVVFRQHRSDGFKGHAARVTATEHGVLAALWERGLAVPRPLLFDDSGASTDPFLVTDWMQGSTDVTPAQLPRALEQMADFLAGLHDLDPHVLHVPGLGPIEDPVASLADHLPDDDRGRRIQHALSSATFVTPGNRVVLLHGDYWPGNILWADGRLVAVIDWEDAQLGDPLADLACARVELRCRYGADAQASFTDLYVDRCRALGHDLDLDRLPLWDVYVSAAALMAMAQWGLEPEEEARRRTDTRAFFEAAAHHLIGD